MGAFITGGDPFMGIINTPSPLGVILGITANIFSDKCFICDFASLETEGLCSKPLSRPTPTFRIIEPQGVHCSTLLMDHMPPNQLPLPLRQPVVLLHNVRVSQVGLAYSSHVAETWMLWLNSQLVSLRCSASLRSDVHRASDALLTSGAVVFLVFVQI